MDYYGPILKTPRIIRSDGLVHRSSSRAPMSYPYVGVGRPAVSSVGPRSRRSFGYSVSDIGRDGSVVTRRFSSSPSYSLPYGGSSYQSYHSMPPPPRQSIYYGRGRSMSIEPVPYSYLHPPVTRYSTVERSLSPVRRTSYHYQSTPAPLRLSRRDSFSQPYYTLNTGSFGHEVVLKRTSAYQPVTPLRSSSVFSYAPSEGKVVAKSNIVSRRTSCARDDPDDLPLVDTANRVSLYRSGTPAMNEENKRYSRQEAVVKRSSVNRYIVTPDSRRNSSISPGSRPPSVANFVSQRGSYSPLPPPPIRRISVIKKSSVENGPRSSIQLIELENVEQRKPVFEPVDKINSSRKELYEDLRKRTLEAKDQLGRHRMMLDRYLPVKLGPEPDVAFEIQNKYGELVERLPYIERRNQFTEEEEKENQDKPRSSVKPYTPASVKSYTSSLFNVHVPSSFTPAISETRRRARDVLCKVKGDPNYFHYH